MFSKVFIAGMVMSALVVKSKVNNIYDADADYGYMENFDDYYGVDYDQIEELYDYNELMDDIAYGAEAALGQFPFVARITYNGQSWCSGSVIGRRLVVTAQHCVVGYSAASMKVYVGEVNRANVETSEQSKGVASINRLGCTQTKDNWHLCYDVSILVLDSDLTFNQWVQPIEIIGYGITNAQFPTVTAAGWGAGESGADTPTLRYASADLKTDTECANKHNTNYPGNMCTAGGEGSTCGGDSGGPLVAKIKNSFLGWVLIGANSWSFTSCSDKAGNWDFFAKMNYQSFYDKMRASYWGQYQLFDTVARDISSVVSGAYYVIQSRRHIDAGHNRALSDMASGYPTFYDFIMHTAQFWEVKASQWGAPWFTIRARGTGKCLSTQTSDAEKWVRAETCTDWTAHQAFYVQKVSGQVGTFIIYFGHNTNCLDISHITTIGNNQQIKYKPCDYSLSQQMILKRYYDDVWKIQPKAAGLS